MCTGGFFIEVKATSDIKLINYSLHQATKVDAGGWLAFKVKIVEKCSLSFCLPPSPIICTGFSRRFLHVLPICRI
jgi:hypothetical protein